MALALVRFAVEKRTSFLAKVHGQSVLRHGQSFARNSQFQRTLGASTRTGRLLLLPIVWYAPVRLSRPENVPDLSRKYSRLLAEQVAARQQLRTLNGNSSYATKNRTEPAKPPFSETPSMCPSRDCHGPGCIAFTESSRIPSANARTRPLEVEGRQPPRCDGRPESLVPILGDGAGSDLGGHRRGRAAGSHNPASPPARRVGRFGFSAKLAPDSLKLDGQIRRLPPDGRRLPWYRSDRGAPDRKSSRGLQMEREGLRLAGRRHLLLGVRSETSPVVSEAPPKAVRQEGR
jgi:hypothetical protein